MVANSRPVARYRDSQPVTRPKRARFRSRDHVVGEPLGRQRAADPGESPPEQAAVALDQPQPHLLAITLAHRRAQVADAVGKPELDGAVGGPKLAREQGVVGTGQARAAPRL